MRRIITLAFIFAVTFGIRAEACGWLTSCNRYEQADENFTQSAREWIQYQAKLKAEERIRQREEDRRERDSEVREKVRELCTKDPTKCADPNMDAESILMQAHLRELLAKQQKSAQ